MFLKSFLFFVIVFTFLHSLFAGSTVIRLGYSDAPAFPFQIAHDVDPPGIAFEILERVCKELNIKVVFVSLPNKRVLHALQQGEIDGAFMYSYKKEREENGLYPMKGYNPDEKKRVATLSYYLYVLKGSALQWDGKNFSGFSASSDVIGANTGYSIVSDLVQKGIIVDDGAKTTEQNFRKLLTKRIIGFAHQDLVADNFLKTQGISNVDKLPVPLVTKSYYLMFSHQYFQKNAMLAQKIWDRIADRRDSITKESVKKYH